MNVEQNIFNTMRPKSQGRTVRDTIIQHIKNGKVIPIIGNAFISDLTYTGPIKGHDSLVDQWARYVNYPYPDQGHKLARIAQYYAFHQSNRHMVDESIIKADYIDFLKQALQANAQHDEAIPSSTCNEVENQFKRLTPSEVARRFNYPKADSRQDNPLLHLADLDLPIYITTSYHDYLELALRQKGKEPQVEVFPWHQGLDSLSSIFESDKQYNPNREQPLVYHLFGIDDNAASLVLTEDDHLDFLTNIFKDGRRNIPALVRRALTESSLVMIGYHPRDWDFRALFRGIIAPRSYTNKTHIAIQVAEDDENLQTYLDTYLRQTHFTVEWCDPSDFIRDIHQGWEHIR